MSFWEPEGQVARWIEQLQEYNFSVEHRKGVTNANADGLSRWLCGVSCGHSGRDWPFKMVCSADVGRNQVQAERDGRLWCLRVNGRRC